MNIFKKIRIHPRNFEEKRKRKAVVIGGTGATGRQLIRKLLDSNFYTYLLKLIA